jgi:alkylation response protein AidB-like acyl-CoA dehydrogenase
MATQLLTKLQGGAWLLNETAEVFSPERLSDDHRMISATAHEFMTNEVLPAIDRLEQKDWALARALVAKAGALGLVGTDVPESFGGVDLDKAASILVGEAIGRSASFATTFGAETGLAIFPLLSFGSDAQKQQYLPGLASGEIVGAYALSESGSGSDAMAARARAVQQPDGSFVLNGEKMWITNGGFADLFIVFAKVDGEHFSAFLVERGFAGVSSGKEEHKMGLHGSSTTPLILQDARVPAGGLLGEVGKGHRVALNTLNYGRFKLAAMCSGGAKAAMAEAAAYASSRKQFNQPIASFGAIQHKLGEMTARVYGAESALYRTCGLIDSSLAASHDLPGALEEFAIEASMLKVSASEMLDYVLDENVQIHGGNGFVKDYPAERHYRDARVNRIFEGTNEINRLLVPGMLARRALKGTLPLIAAAKALQDELLAPPSLPSSAPDRMAAERTLVAGMKTTALAILGTAMQTYGQKMVDQQEVLSFASDMITDAFVAESSLLRALQAATDDAARATLHEAAARVVIHTAAARVEASAREALAAMTHGDMLRTLLAALRRWLKSVPADLVSARRALAGETIQRRKYAFDIH